MSRISDLPALSSAANTDELVILQGGVVYRGNLSQLTTILDTDLQGQITTNDTDITNLQNQKVDLAGDTMTGQLVAVGDPIANGDLSRKVYVDTADNLRLLLAGGTMSGNLDMGTNTISNVVDPTNAQDAATQNYVITTTAKILENYDPTGTSAYPTTYGGAAITDGDRYYITTAGTMAAGASVVQIGDVIEARQDAAGDNTAHWSITNANTETASATLAGIVELSTDAETQALTSTAHAVTPGNLGALNSSTAQEGLVELATDGEFETGTDSTRAVTASNVFSEITTFEQFVGPEHIIHTTAGTWTATMSAVTGDIYNRKTAAAEAPIIIFDISPLLRTVASRGFSLSSFDVIYKIGTANLVAHTVTLTLLNYTDNSAATPTNSTPAITGTLQTATNANIRVSNVTVDAPAYLTTAVAKYTINITANAAGTTIYDIYGVNLKFSKRGF